MSKPSFVPSRSMLVTRSSPAPRSATSRAHATASRPGRQAAAVEEDLPPGAVRRRLASIATTMHCAPNRSAQRADQLGSRTAAELIETLSAPAASTSRTSSSERMPPPMVNGMKTSVGRAAGELDDRVALLVAGGDVEEHQLVGALGVVARGQLHGVARVAEADEVHALHDAPVVDVQARDHPDHGGRSPASDAPSASATVNRPS